MHCTALLIVHPIIRGAPALFPMQSEKENLSLQRAHEEESSPLEIGSRESNGLKGR